MKTIVKFFEIDVPFCLNAYGDGVSPLTGNCTAEVGVTGDQKCFNTFNYSHDCQDPVNYSAGTKTIRFLQRDSGYLPADLDGIPILDDWRISGGRMSPGENFGSRFVLSVDLFDCKHNDTGIDPYISERAYKDIAYENGTFLGKFRAKFPFLEGAACRAYEGYLGQDYSEYTCYNFIIDKMEGPDERFKARLIATDFLKLLNDEKALAPVPSNGYLSADYIAGTTSVTLTPVGIGDLEYGLTGRVAIGKEIFDYTRVATTDVLTLSPAMADAHKSGEVAQNTLVYGPQSAGLIAEDLIANHSPLSTAYTDGATWAARIAEVNNFSYQREIVKPTATRKLFNELIEQVGLTVRANLITNKVDLDVLRPNPITGKLVSEEIIQPNSFRQSDQPEKRYDKAIVYYDKRDPFSSDEPESYYSAAGYLDADIKYPTINTKVVYSQWIQAGGFSPAQAVATRLVARYKRPPRVFEFSLFGEDQRNHGEIVPFSYYGINDATGSRNTINTIIVSALQSKKQSKYIAEEYTIDAGLYSGDIIIPFDYDDFNIVLREKYNQIVVGGVVDTSPSAPDVIFIIRAGFKIGSKFSSVPSIIDGDWPAGFTPKLVIEAGAGVYGKGGNGGYGGDGVGEDGSDAIQVTSALDIDNQGTIGGGGGGGGGSKLNVSPFTAYRGGGGAGFTAGFGDSGGTLATGGLNDIAGDGGDLGQDGTSGDSGPISHAAGGSAGAAINGVSNVTFTNAGTILGAQIG